MDTSFLISIGMNQAEWKKLLRDFRTLETTLDRLKKDFIGLKTGATSGLYTQAIKGTKSAIIESVPVGATVVVRTFLIPCFWIFSISGSHS